MYRSDKFRLVINDDDQILYFEGRTILKGCEKIIKLFMEISLSDEDNPPSAIISCNLSQEELNDLEKTLARAILDDDKCMPKNIDSD